MTQIANYENYSILPNGTVFNKKGLEISQFNKDGYRCVSLYKNGYKKNFRVHKLVAETFGGAKPTDTIDHIDRDKSNNNLENLRIVNVFQNLHNTDPLSNKNESGYRGIYIAKGKKETKFRLCVSIMNVIHRKTFDSLEEAIKYRDSLKKEIIFCK